MLTSGVLPGGRTHSCCEVLQLLAGQLGGPGGSPENPRKIQASASEIRAYMISVKGPQGPQQLRPGLHRTTTISKSAVSEARSQKHGSVTLAATSEVPVFIPFHWEVALL